MRFRRANSVPFRLSGRLALWSAVLLVLAGILVTVYEERGYRAQKLQEARVQAQILAASVTAALAFNDRATAQEYVSALEANPEIEAAGVYDTSGANLAGFVRPDTEALPPRPDITQTYMAGGRIFVTMPVIQGSTTLGNVYLRAGIEAFNRRLARYSGIVILVVMAVLVLAVSAAAQRALRRANQTLALQAQELAQSNVRLQGEMQERAKAEEALRQSQKMEAIGQLSGGIAHDFNNLLTIIQGNLQLLRRRVAEGRTDLDRYIGGAMEGVTRAANLTQRILAFSRRQPLTPKPLNLGKLLQEMHDLLRHSVGDQVEIKMRPDTDWLVLCDANQMENVILNLAINARDAMPNGGSLIIEIDNRSAPFENDAAAADWVALRVSDTGIGMTKEVRQRAVDPFFTTKPLGKGTGLGLSMTFGYVQQSGGHLDIQSEPGKGTTITILLPRFVPQSVPVGA